MVTPGIATEERPLLSSRRRNKEEDIAIAGGRTREKQDILGIVQARRMVRRIIHAAVVTGPERCLFGNIILMVAVVCCGLTDGRSPLEKEKMNGHGSHISVATCFST